MTFSSYHFPRLRVRKPVLQCSYHNGAVLVIIGNRKENIFTSICIHDSTACASVPTMCKRLLITLQRNLLISWRELCWVYIHTICCTLQPRLLISRDLVVNICCIFTSFQVGGLTRGVLVIMDSSMWARNTGQSILWNVVITRLFICDYFCNFCMAFFAYELFTFLMFKPVFEQDSNVYICHIIDVFSKYYTRISV